MPWGGRARLTDAFGVAAEPTDALGGQNSLNRPPSHQLQAQPPLNRPPGHQLQAQPPLNRPPNHQLPPPGRPRHLIAPKNTQPPPARVRRRALSLRPQTDTTNPAARAPRPTPAHRLPAPSRPRGA